MKSIIVESTAFFLAQPVQSSTLGSMSHTQKRRSRAGSISLTSYSEPKLTAASTRVSGCSLYGMPFLSLPSSRSNTSWKKDCCTPGNERFNSSSMRTQGSLHARMNQDGIQKMWSYSVESRDCDWIFCRHEVSYCECGISPSEKFLFVCHYVYNVIRCEFFLYKHALFS